MGDSLIDMTHTLWYHKWFLFTPKSLGLQGKAHLAINKLQAGLYSKTETVSVCVGGGGGREIQS